MRWTKDTPTKEGVYWWKHESVVEVVVVFRFDGHADLSMKGALWKFSADMDECDGSQWAGPLTPPDDQAKEEG